MSLLRTLVVAPLVGCAVAPAPNAVSAPIAEAPFALVRNQIVLEVRVEGAHPFFMLLDTGGNPSAVDLGAARDAGLWLDTTAAGEAEGAGGERVPIYAARIAGLEVGGMVARELAAVALDLGHVAERLGHPLHGVLGYNFLRDRTVQIDYPGRVVRFYEHAPSSRTGTFAYDFPLELRPGGTIPLLRDVRVNGRDVTVTLDTGSSLGLELFSWALDDLGSSVTERSASGSAVGARGEIETRIARTDSVRVGPFSLGPLDATVVEKERRPDRPEVGNLGNDVLRDFVLTLDYVGGMVRLERPAAGGTPRDGMASPAGVVTRARQQSPWIPDCSTRRLRSAFRANPEAGTVASRCGVIYRTHPNCRECTARRCVAVPRAGARSAHSVNGRARTARASLLAMVPAVLRVARVHPARER